MKPLLMRHVQASNGSFKVWANGSPYMHNPWHYHPECELTFIQEGKGTLYIGDRMIEYSANDFILLGPNLPHEWRSDYEESPDYHSRSLAIHFNRDLFGSGFYQLPEVSSINMILDKANRGLKIENPKTKAKVKKKLVKLYSSEGISRICKLLDILDVISRSPGLSYLASSSFTNATDYSQSKRLNIVYDYVKENFRNPISIREVAQLINMIDSSFCRYFKERTNKSFIAYLNEVRIGYACRLLLEGELNISQVAYESGFSNISNFNKNFKNIKSITPSQFIKEYRKE